MNLCSELSGQNLELFDLEKFWLTNKLRLPKIFNITRWFIKIPASSTDSERALSKYKIILDDKRTCQSDETIKINNFLYFNTKKEYLSHETTSEIDEDSIIDTQDVVAMILDNDSD